MKWLVLAVLSLVCIADVPTADAAPRRGRARVGVRHRSFVRHRGHFRHRGFRHAHFLRVRQVIAVDYGCAVSDVIFRHGLIYVRDACGRLVLVRGY